MAEELVFSLFFILLIVICWKCFCFSVYITRMRKKLKFKNSLKKVYIFQKNHLPSIMILWYRQSIHKIHHVLIKGMFFIVMASSRWAVRVEKIPRCANSDASGAGDLNQPRKRVLFSLDYATGIRELKENVWVWIPKLDFETSILRNFFLNNKC